MGWLLYWVDRLDYLRVDLDLGSRWLRFEWLGLSELD